MTRAFCAAFCWSLALAMGCGEGNSAARGSVDGGASGGSSSGGASSGGSSTGGSDAGGSANGGTNAGASGGGSGNGGAAGGGGDGGGAGGNGGGSGAGGPVTCIGGGTDCPDLECAEGYRCTADPAEDVVWVMKEDGNVNGPDCQRVCEAALPNNCAYYACDEGRPVKNGDSQSFGPIAEGLGFDCREGGCWSSESPSAGQYLVSIETDADGTKSCYFPTATTLSCSDHPGNANCFGERYSTVCACVAKSLDEACNWSCPPNGTTRAVWKTSGTSCLERINYWRKRACEEGWVECPPAGLPPMVECTACHECANSEADWDQEHGAHDSFKRCGESSQGEGGGQTCADVIDGFVSERKPDASGVMRCEGHCGPIVKPGCQTFHWGKDLDTGFHTLNWGSCDVEKCEAWCNDNPATCYTHSTSPSLTCDDPTVGGEPAPVVMGCQ